MFTLYARLNGQSPRQSRETPPKNTPPSESVVTFYKQNGFALDALERPNADGQRVAHLAARQNQAHVLEDVLRRTDNRVVATRDSLQDTPLHIAVRANAGGIVKALLAAGADPNAQNARGMTPLHSGCLKGVNVGLVRTLIAESATDLERLNSDDQTALFLAVAKHHHELVDCLLAHPKMDVVRLKAAAPKITELAYAIDNITTILSFACHLLRASPPRPNVEPLHHAHHQPFVGGAPAPLVFHKDQGWHVSATHLAKNDGKKAIHHAAEGAEESVLLSIIGNAGHDVVDEIGPDHMRPLHVAVVADRPHIVTALLSRGADVTKTDCSGNTPLHYACMHGVSNETLAVLLTASRLDINCVNAFGKTPLMHAVIHRMNHLIADLVAHPDIDVDKCLVGRGNVRDLALEEHLLNYKALLILPPEVDSPSVREREHSRNLGAEAVL